MRKLLDKFGRWVSELGYKIQWLANYDPTVCSVCGRQNVDIEVWFDLRSGRPGDWTGSSDDYCNNCDDVCKLVTKEEYEASLEKHKHICCD